MQALYELVCWSHDQWKNCLVRDQFVQVSLALGEPVAVDMDEMFHLLREIQCQVVEASRVWTEFTFSMECSRIRRRIMGKRKRPAKGRSRRKGMIMHRVRMPWKRGE